MINMMEKQRVEYPLSPKYIPDWDIEIAIRELIANALDTNKETSIYWETGWAIIEDIADGIPRRFWVLGEGDHGEIGQFGEGLKMSMLVLARYGVPVSLSTVGYSVTPSIQYSDTYHAEIMVLEYVPNSRIEGTSIRARVQKKDFLSARNKFLRLNPKVFIDNSLGILDSPGELYVNGVLVSNINSIWGYNISSKTMMNRDRSIVDDSQIRLSIRNILEKLTDENLICELLERSLSKSEPMKESTIYFYIPFDNRDVWKKSFHKIYGQRACLSYDSPNDIEVRALGWSPCSFAYDIRSALSLCGVKDSREIRKELGDEKPVIAENLTVEERSLFHRQISLSERILPILGLEYFVVEKFPGLEQEGVVASYKDSTVYLHRSLLEDESSLIGSILHEKIHHLGYHDCTRDFEDKLTKLLGELAMNLD